MVCKCHEEERRNGTPFRKCDQNGRRLNEAWAMVKKTSDDFLKSAAALTLSDCEGDGELHSWLVGCLRHASAYLETRFKYLSSIPWAFCNANTRDGATDCLQQFHSVPRASHDSFSILFFEEFGSAMQAVSEGGDASDALNREVALINTACLDESAGEGYHRGTNLTKIHCPGAKTPYIVQSQRFQGSVKQMKTFLLKFGEQGRGVVRFDWLNYKRVLQTGDPWKPVRMGTRDFFDRVYRMDEKSLEDWSPIITKPGQVEVSVSAAETTTEEMALEYLDAVFRPLDFYSIPQPQESLDGGGGRYENRPKSIPSHS